MKGHFESKASGPQKLQRYMLRGLYASSLGKKTFLKVRQEPRAMLHNLYISVLTVLI